uniref:LRRCT domain-containing protein n=1 Tax=Fundulus heteroclitus TaxID=8078 RepID=A0A3Q2QM35_FUNHE
MRVIADRCACLLLVHHSRDPGLRKITHIFNSIHNMVFLLMIMMCFLVLVGGFSLQSCQLSNNKAICVMRRLTTIPQDIPPTVTGFDLSVNRLTRIQQSDFTPLPLLLYLDLNRNKISQIDSAAFATLTSLKKLNLNNNKVVKLEERAFDGSSNLIELRINHNQIKAVSSTSFLSLTKLKLLDISYNKLQKITDLHLILQHMPQLEELVLRGNSLKTFHSWELTNHSLDLRTIDLTFNPLQDFRITADVFQNLSRLKIGNPFGNKSMTWDVRNNTFLSRVSSLDVSGLIVPLDDMETLLQAVNSSLTFLRMNSMRLNQSHLIGVSCSIPTMFKLQLQRNKMKSINSDFFKSCINLTELDLAYNAINNIQQNAFTALKCLKVLRLSSNKLSSVPNATRNLENLSELDLSNNNIPSVTCTDFSNQTKLKELSLQTNSISALDDCTFKDLLQLQVLRLQSNQITHLNGAFKNHLPNLKRLYLNGNKLTTILPNEFGGLRSLLNLSLHQNQIKVLHKDSFVGLKNLTHIFLQSNSIQRQALKSGAFNALSNLRKLDLNSNHIRYLDSSPLTRPPFSNLSRLEELSIFGQHSSGKSFLSVNFLQGLNNLLSFNARKLHITSLNKDMFQHTPKLENLDVAANDLSNVSSQLFAPVRNLKNLYLHRTGLHSLDFLIDANLTKLEFLQVRHNQFSVVTEDVINFSCDCDNAWFLNWTIANTQTQVDDAYNYTCNYPDDFKNTRLLDFDFTSCLEDKGFICFVSTTSLILLVMVSSFTYYFMRSQLYIAYYLFWAWLFESMRSCNHMVQLGGAETQRNLRSRFEDPCPKAILVPSGLLSFRLFDEQKDVLILVFLEDIPTYLLSPYHRMRKLLKKQTYLRWPRAADQPEVFWEKLRKALQSGHHLNEDKLRLTVTGAQP